MVTEIKKTCVKIHGRDSMAKVSDWVNFHHLASEVSCIQTWFHRFAQPGSSLAKNLAGGLQHGRQLSFSTEVFPTILQYNFFSLLVRATCPVLGMCYKQDGCPTRQENVYFCGHVWGLFTAKLKSDRASQGTPCNAINYITS